MEQNESPPAPASATALADEVAHLLTQRGHEVERDVRFEWLTNRVPADPDLELPPQLKYRLLGLHTELGGDWDALLQKRRQPLRVHIKVDDNILVQVDTRSSFSSERLTTLDFYDGLEHSLDLDIYRGLCLTHQSEIPTADRRRRAAEFAFPGGRGAQVAYFDAVRDLLSAGHGYRLLRVPAPTGELTSMATQSIQAL